MSMSLGIESFKDDDLSPIHNRPIWQKMCQIARECGVRVYVKPIGAIRTEWEENGEGVSLTINKAVPNWHKSVLLAKKICLWGLVRTLIESELSEEKIQIPRRLVEEMGGKLFKEVYCEINPSPVQPEGWNEAARESREKQLQLQQSMEVAV